MSVYEIVEGKDVLGDPVNRWASAAALIPGERLVGKVGGKIVQEADKVIEGVAKSEAKVVNKVGQTAIDRGKASEKRVLDELGEAKNTKNYVTSHDETIPDFENATQVGEIKDVKSLSNTKQMRAQRELAEKTGREHVVVTGQNTKVTKPMKNSGSRIERRPDLGPQNDP